MFEILHNSVQRIGIFQARWPLQSHTVNSALMLTRAGYSVDLFLYNVDKSYTGDQLSDIRNIQIHSFSDIANGPGKVSATSRFVTAIRSNIPVLHRVLRTLWKIANNTHEEYLIWRKLEDGLIPSSVLKETIRLMDGKQYKALIGIEKRGLVWAGQVSGQLKIPYLYHSLDLYTRDHREYMNTNQAKRLKMAEEYYHKGSSATIIQDQRRAEVLFEENKVHEKNLLYVPISSLGQTHRERSDYLQKKFHIRKHKILILQFGLIVENRLSLELTKLAQRFPEDWLLVFHGVGPQSVIKRIQETDKKQRILLSLDLVPMIKLQELIASAHIGLVLYQKSPLNDYLTAFSSEKLALQLQCGLPVIAFNYPGYEILEKSGCGVLIKTLQELPQAVEQIMSSYDTFRTNAFKCFSEHYEFSKNYQKVIDFLNNL